MAGGGFHPGGLHRGSGLDCGKRRVDEHADQQLHARPGLGHGPSRGRDSQHRGGTGITLSHVGSVFEVSQETLPRWKRWYRHVARDQWAVWAPACFVGLALPSMLSVQFLRRGTDAGDWNAAAMTAEQVGSQVANPPEGVLAASSGLSQVFHGQAGGISFGDSRCFAVLGVGAQHGGDDRRHSSPLGGPVLDGQRPSAGSTQTAFGRSISACSSATACWASSCSG